MNMCQSCKVIRDLSLWDRQTPLGKVYIYIESQANRIPVRKEFERPYPCAGICIQTNTLCMLLNYPKTTSRWRRLEVVGQCAHKRTQLDNSDTEKNWLY